MGRQAEEHREPTAGQRIREQKRRKALRTHRMIRRGLTVCGVLVVLGAMYMIISTRYLHRFMPGTVLNGVKLSGKSLKKAEELLIRDAQENYTLTVKFRGGETQVLTGSSIDLTVSFRDEVENVLDEQDSLTWLPRLFGRGKVEETIGGLRLYDLKKLASWTMGLPQLQAENMQAPVDAHMQIGEDGLIEAVSEEEGCWLNADVVKDAVENAVAGGEPELDLDQVPGAYAKAQVLLGDEGLSREINRLNFFLATNVTYSLPDGSTESVDGSRIAGWLKESETHAGWFDLTTESLMESIRTYVADLSARTDITYESYDFASTNQGLVNLPVNVGSYGYRMNQEAETEALFKDIIGSVTETRVPVYSVATSLSGGIGDTYIEVDLLAQKVYLYKGGTLFYSSDCVSGLATDWERVTPRGVYALYDKETNRTLEGTVEEDTGQPEYSSYVNYWMPFCDRYGLHDASWRQWFGGEIYQTQGSHGCVNLPPVAAATIFDAVEIGTPVVIL
ncbi:MAG: L,D-transpeptidase [Lachnospiraceae bacterium]|nr:L,D-transpeptidase [Lachnospiraceae bacterium]